MTERAAKVIKGLECHANEGDCAECPYKDGWHTCRFNETLLVDAINLLKEYESERLKFIEGTAKLVAENEMLKADRPEIVRCKDCKYFNRSRLLCDHPTSHVYRTIMPDWFCADGRNS